MKMMHGLYLQHLYIEMNPYEAKYRECMN